MSADIATAARKIWISIGANIPGNWGHPNQTLQLTLKELECNGIKVFARSRSYFTPPLGSTWQPEYLNAVIGVHTSMAPGQLLRLLKRLERLAGRRRRGRWQARPLDLDILDFGGRIMGRPEKKRVDGRLILPHPELHRRAFVLLPLAEVAPGWRHPRLGLRARTLLARLPGGARGIRLA
jgi:2-amino-4-hydroxy-6-hydroxymethyldihydropteridine diphosphokinase